MIGAKTVLLVHQIEVQHFRVAIYNYLYSYLADRGWHLCVVSRGIEDRCPHEVEFDLRVMPLEFARLRRLVKDIQPQAVILFANLRESYLFPFIVSLKLGRVPVIYWGHAIDLEDKQNRLKGIAYALEHELVDAILLYGDGLKRYVAKRHHRKVFVANNTLNTRLLKRRHPDCSDVLERYGVRTTRNVICVGRLQRRKGIHQLIDAFSTIAESDVGLILVGPDSEGILSDHRDPRVVWVGPLYGPAVQELMECADVYCMPGHVGLSIVDAFFFGLPMVTTDVDHAPEIMYLRDGVNGFMLPSGDPVALAATLQRILTDDDLRRRLSEAAEQTVRSEASIDTMCAGFAEVLQFADRSTA